MKEKKHFNGYGLVICLLAAFMVVVSGCSINHDYQWSEYKIAPERIASADTLDSKSTVSIINSQTDNSKRLLGRMGAYKYHGSLKQLTAAVKQQLSQELTLREVNVTADAAKKLDIKVTSAYLVTGMWKLRADINVSLKTASGYSRTIKIENGTPTSVYQAYNGAVALAVIDILNDPAILKYLKD